MNVQSGEGSTTRFLYGEPREGDETGLEPLFRGAAPGALDKLAALLEAG